MARTAAQRAASRANLVKAREARKAKRAETFGSASDRDLQLARKSKGAERRFKRALDRGGTTARLRGENVSTNSYLGGREARRSGTHAKITAEKKSNIERKFLGFQNRGKKK